MYCIIVLQARNVWPVTVNISRCHFKSLKTISRQEVCENLLKTIKVVYQPQWPSTGGLQAWSGPQKLWVQNIYISLLVVDCGIADRRLICMYAYIYSDIHTVRSRISSLPLPLYYILYTIYYILYYILYTILYYTNAHIEINTQWQQQAVKWALGKIKYFKGEFPPHAEPWVWCQRYSQTFCLSSQSLCCGVSWCNGRRSQTQLHSLNEYGSIEWRVGGKVCVNAAVHWLEPQSLDRRRVEL